MKKAIVIDECADCPHFEVRGWIPPIWCKIALRERSSTIGIPEWCPLPDIPSNNAGENCFYRGGYGCNNIRLDVPWKSSKG